MAALLTVEGVRIARPGPAGPLDLLRAAASLSLGQQRHVRH